jgi:hypothetical protein
MKSNDRLRANAVLAGPEDTLRKAAKLEPVKKGGKEKRAYIRELDDGELELTYRKRDSVLDYFDDGENTDTEDVWEEMDENDDNLPDDWEEDWLDGPEVYDDEDTAGDEE